MALTIKKRIGNILKQAIITKIDLGFAKYSLKFNKKVVMEKATIIAIVVFNAFALF